MTIKCPNHATCKGVFSFRVTHEASDYAWAECTEATCRCPVYGEQWEALKRAAIQGARSQR
jgi:hypothetical protein